jgi:hypothetical protein
LLRIALDQTGAPADGGCGKDPGEPSPGQPADAVNPKHVQGIVVVETMLQPGAGPEAYQARNHPDNDAVPGRDEAGRETSDRANPATHRRRRTPANSRRLPRELERVAVSFAGANPPRVIDRRHENLAVADLTGAGTCGDDLDRLGG